MPYEKKSFAPTPVNLINFGKYKGKTFEEVHEIDAGYLLWMRDTTDPADQKNEGKYAKQNQARIKYISELLDGGPTTTVGTPLPKATHTPSVATTPVPTKTFETILQCLMKIEEKVDIMAKAMKIEMPVVMKAELEPDEEVPFSDEEPS